MSKTPLLIIYALIGFGLGYFLFSQNSTPFESLSSEEMLQKIVGQRDYAIQKAKDNGNYKCCIEPPCTMCYMEANQWNNHTAGTCACDDLIAQGKDTCPQCKQGLCEGNQHSCGTNN